MLHSLIAPMYIAAALVTAPVDPADDMASALPVTAMAGADGSCAAMFIDAPFDLAGLRRIATDWPSKDIAVRVERAADAPEGCVEAVAAEIDQAAFATVYLPDSSVMARTAAPPAPVPEDVIKK